MLQYEIKAALWLPRDNPRHALGQVGAISQQQLCQPSLSAWEWEFLLFAPPCPVNNQDTAGSSVGHLWGHPRVGSNSRLCQGSRGSRSLLKYPEHNPTALPSIAPDTPWCASRNNGLKDSGLLKEAETEETRLFSPNKSLLSSKSVPNDPSDGNKKGKARCVHQLYFTIHLLHVNKSQAGERN